MNLQRMKQLAGIKLNESVVAVPNIGRRQESNKIDEMFDEPSLNEWDEDPSERSAQHREAIEATIDYYLQKLGVNLGSAIDAAEADNLASQIETMSQDEYGRGIDAEEVINYLENRSLINSEMAVSGLGEQGEFDTYAGQPKPSYEGKSREELEAQLAKLQAEFDPGFEYSDDHSFWKRQTAIKKHIAAIEQALAGLNEDESDMQTAATVASNQGDIGFDMAQGGVTESDDEITDEMVRQAYEQRHKAFATGAANRYALADRASALANQFAQQQSMKNHGRGFDPISGNLLPENEQSGQSLDEKSSSEKQARFMAAAAHDPRFAKKVGISGDVAKEFNKADTGTKQLSNAMKNKKTESVPAVDSCNQKNPANADLACAMEEDIQNGYDTKKYANGEDYFPNGADGPVVKATGPSGAKQGDNPEQKKMQVAETHKELVYAYRSFLKESANTKKKIV